MRGLAIVTDSYAVYYFSATGNSFLVASSLTQRLGVPEPISIPGTLILDDPYEAARTATKVGFVFPVHRATVPEMVSGFITQMPARSDCYYFAISTHSWFGCNEFWDIDEILNAKGAALNFASSIRMTGSLGVVPPSEYRINKRIAQIQPQLDEIAEEISNSQERYFRPAIKSLNEIVRRFTIFRRQRIKFHIDEQCKQCGICAQVCPARNIELLNTGIDVAEDNRAPVRSDKCQACYACLHWCPINAISTSYQLHNRYHNPQVTPDQLNQVPFVSSESDIEKEEDALIA